MKILELLYREEQRSLLCEEQSEVRTVFAIVHDLVIGHLRIDSYFNKRDADETYFCDVPGVTAEFIANSDWSWKLSDEMWKEKPTHVKETPTLTEIIIKLADHQLKANNVPKGWDKV